MNIFNEIKNYEFGLKLIIHIAAGYSVKSLNNEINSSLSTKAIDQTVHVAKQYFIWSVQMGQSVK